MQGARVVTHGPRAGRGGTVLRSGVRRRALCAASRGEPRLVTEPSGSRKVYDGDLFDVVVEDWNGREQEIVEHPGATAIVAIDQEGYVTLVRQTREAARKQLV